MTRHVDRERENTVDRARVLYPDAFRRVLAACRHAAFGFDVELHVARIVLATNRHGE